MEHDTGQVQAGGCSGKLAEQEEACPCEVAPSSQTLGEVAVDTGQSKTIVQGKQPESNDNIAGHEAQAHLEIRHAARPDPTRNADKAHTADACPNHTEGHKQPRRFPAGTEECVVVALRLHKPREYNQQEDV